MSIDAVDVDSFGLEDWLKREGAGELQRALEKRILKALFSNDLADFQFRQMAAQLAWIGTHPEDRALLQREIIELNSFCDDAIMPCGIFNSVWKGSCKVARFIADHKTEILVGAAVVATGAGVAAAAGYTLSATVGGIVVAGAGSIFTPDEKPNPHIPRVPPPSSKEEITIVQQGLPSSLPKLELPFSSTEIFVTAEGIWAGGQFFPNSDLMQHSFVAEELAKCGLVDKIHFPDTSKIADSVANRSTTVEPQQTSPLVSFEKTAEFRSGKFTIAGEKKEHIHIGWINGINNVFEESAESGKYLQKLAGGCAVSGIYNCTHTPLIDILEAGLLNYNGYSPNTAKLLRSEWEAFHKANTKRSNAKLLQVCHSQGAIHVKNALEKAPPEIRDRVIVVAIAPAAVVPKRLCFRSFNYASEKDFVHKLEPGPPRPVTSITLDDVLIPTFGEAIDDRGELIILKAHENAKGIDHEFQSLTYRDPLQRVLENYNQHGGEYGPEKKEKLK